MAKFYIPQDFLLHTKFIALHSISIFKTLLPPCLIFTPGGHSLLHNILNLIILILLRIMELSDMHEQIKLKLLYEV